MKKRESERTMREDCYFGNAELASIVIAGVIAIIPLLEAGGEL